MKSRIIIFLMAVAVSVAAVAKKYDNITDVKYNRSSVYSILLNHTEQRFGNEIKEQFINIPVPDQYNSHDLNIKVINVSGKGEFLDSIDAFIENNHIASRMVAKWFDRDILSGACSMDLVKQRGIYNASELDRELAARSARGMAMLADAGEELIGHSFLLVNEIKYVDKSKASGAVGAGLKIFGALAGGFLGRGVGDLFDTAGDMVASIKGFKVKITTHLYQLVWDEEAQGTFYRLCYTEVPDEDKKIAFENNRKAFRLSYVGRVESAGSNTSFMGINEQEPLLMVRKACQRAIDENIVDLQKNYDCFRVKAPVMEVIDNDNIM
ncbi:MAG: hypothetical protein K2O12_02690, partial [Muribaculaceae bacterium]|nr:hypothetical protein [Muribaculaceae bacterium]